MTAIPDAPPIGRDLDAGELRTLVADIAADPARWHALVRADTAGRHFEQLSLDDHVGVWVITWARGNDTGFHDHDLSHGAVAVVAGEIVEERLVVGGPPRRVARRAGEVFHFDASHVHRMLKDDAALAVSIHAYSPPLSRMGAYEIDADGALLRRSISSAEELRVVGTAA